MLHSQLTRPNEFCEKCIFAFNFFACLNFVLIQFYYGSPITGIVSHIASGFLFLNLKNSQNDITNCN